MHDAQQPVTGTIREGLAGLGPAALYAVAAAERRLADTVADRDRRRVHIVAANAAQRLADRLVAAQ